MARGNGQHPARSGASPGATSGSRCHTTAPRACPHHTRDLGYWGMPHSPMRGEPALDCIGKQQTPTCVLCCRSCQSAVEDNCPGPPWTGTGVLANTPCYLSGLWHPGLDNSPFDSTAGVRPASPGRRNHIVAARTTPSAPAIGMRKKCYESRGMCLRWRQLVAVRSGVAVKARLQSSDCVYFGRASPD